MVQPKSRALAILIFDDVEVLDFCGPFEVFSVANRFTDPPAFQVVTVAEKAGPVLTRGGLSVNPHRRLADCPPPDVLLVPGGQGTRREMHNPALIDWVRQASAKAELVLSVCTGALLLAKAGLLDGLAATTHHGAIDLLRQTAPRTEIHADRRFVDNGRVVCSAGIAAGIDMSLHVVGRLLGEEVAARTARQMEYPWGPGGSAPARWKLLVLGGTFAVCRLAGAAPVPAWAAGDFLSVTRTAEELSVVCPEAAVPEGVKCERGWRCLRVAGTVPFAAVGTLASLAGPLAAAGVSLFAVSTFDTDYLLVKGDCLERAVSALRGAGHVVSGEGAS